MIERVKTILFLPSGLRMEMFSVKLKVFTLPTCKNCPTAKKIAQEIAGKYGLEFLEVDISTSDGELEGLMYQIMSTPSIAIDYEVISRGNILSREELDAEVRKRLGDEAT